MATSNLRERNEKAVHTTAAYIFFLIRLKVGSARRKSGKGQRRGIKEKTKKI